MMGWLTRSADTFIHRRNRLVEAVRSSLLEAYALSALGYAQLGAYQRAKQFLDDATAISPTAVQNNALWLLANAEFEPDVEQKLHYLRRAVEVAPLFEIALFRKAHYSEMRLRMQDDLSFTRIRGVIDEYDEVLKVNPGNIAALAAQGYLYWLCGRH